MAQAPASWHCTALPIIGGMRRVLLAALTLMISNALHAGTLTDDLKLLAHERIFFGHQSVGKNVLDGLQELSVAAGVPLRIAQLPRAADLDGPGGGAFFVAGERAPPPHAR